MDLKEFLENGFDPSISSDAAEKIGEEYVVRLHSLQTKSIPENCPVCNEAMRRRN